MHHDDTVIADSERLICGGHAVEAVEALRTLPACARGPRFWLALGDAHRFGGDFDAALTAYGNAADLGGVGALACAVTWRVGLAHNELGQPRRALELYERASTAPGDVGDQSRLGSSRAMSHWLLGDTDKALTHAQNATELAAAADDPRVKAAAHTVLGCTISLDGDLAAAEAEYSRAAGYAAAAGDAHQLIRVDIGRCHRLLADARFAEVVGVAAAASEAAQKMGATHLLADALCHQGDALVWLGRYEQAHECFDRVSSLADRIGAYRTAGALLGVARVHLRRGAHEQARAALEQALQLTVITAGPQVRLPAMACLALTMLPNDVAGASAVAAEALAEAVGAGRLPALVAAGWAAWAGDQVEAARALASCAVELARHHRQRVWLAEALELRAATADPDQAISALREAHQIWHDAGAIHDADRVLIHLAQRAPSRRDYRMAARLAVVRLTSAGLPDSGWLHEAPTHHNIQIRTFGRFEVRVDGLTVSTAAWKSRQARDLLRTLVCRRGRAITRDQLCELLWPDDDPDRTRHRLSVLLSIVRGVIGPSALIADQDCVALNADRVHVDVEQFLDDVGDAVALYDQGTLDDARTLLQTAVRCYTDEPFADTPYDDATTPLRDQAQAAYLQALRQLANLCQHEGKHDQAVAHLWTLLHHDRYDEHAYRTLLRLLVRTGRHGQARQAAARYRAAMADLGLPASPVERLLEPPQRAAS